MSKRKREIEKRKKQAEDVHIDESFRTPDTAEDVVTDKRTWPGKSGPDGPPSHETPDPDSRIVSARASAGIKKKPAQQKKPSDPQPVAAATSDSWFGQNKENLLLGLLILYVFLLGLGTVGELFEIAWILNLPLFR